MFKSNLSSPRYLAFLVRIWQEHPAGPWYALVRNVITGEVQHFRDLESLYLYFHRQTEPENREK